jgi:hypothetical protein
MRLPDSFIFNGLLPLKMAVSPYTALVSVLSRRKLLKQIVSRVNQIRVKMRINAIE